MSRRFFLLLPPLSGHVCRPIAYLHGFVCVPGSYLLIDSKHTLGPAFSDPRVNLDVVYLTELTVHVPLSLLVFYLYVKQDAARLVIEPLLGGVQIVGTIAYVDKCVVLCRNLLSTPTLALACAFHPLAFIASGCFGCRYYLPEAISGGHHWPYQFPVIWSLGEHIHFGLVAWCIVTMLSGTMVGEITFFAGCSHCVGRHRGWVGVDCCTTTFALPKCSNVADLGCTEQH